MNNYSDISFRDKIAYLQDEYKQNPYNSNRNQTFWEVMDSISDELAVKWAERASRIKNPVMYPEFLSDYERTKEWEQLNRILYYYKTRDPMTQLPWTKAQKRFTIFQIIKYWDDLEMSYYC
jgi:hypothetical protein